VYVFVIVMVYCAICANVAFRGPISVDLLCIHLFSCKVASVLDKLAGPYGVKGQPQ